MPKQIVIILIIFLAVVILGVPYYLLGSVVAENPLSVGRLKSALNEQGNIFEQPLGTLGITGHPTKALQCAEDHETHWVIYYICQDAYTYPNRTAAISASALQSFPSNAAHFDALLKQNGWISNQPDNTVATVSNSNPFLAQNGGVGAEVAFHKEMGPISCDLEIDFNSLTGETDPGSINVSAFGCQQMIRLFTPNPTGDQIE